MKIIFASFEIAKWGGIVNYVASMLRAFKELGCEVDVYQFTAASTTQRAYDKKFREFEDGTHQRKIKYQSQGGGYEKDETVGYYRNNYYGYFLPPGHRIGVYQSDAFELWRKATEDVDIILWNFLPTKTKAWERKGVKFDFWWKFLDLPDRIKQVFLVHDGYFNVRASNVTEFKDKLLFLGCAHLAAYQCCADIAIPRTLLLNPRYIKDDARMPINLKRKREVDFFAAHMFKSMKHMEELIAAVPYLPEGTETMVAGTGIEYNYMTSPTKTKSTYMCTRKRDPELPKELDGKISLWNRAEKAGMEYMGQLSTSEVLTVLQNAKFAVDPSYAEHYSHSCRTHINGFIIEAMLQGAYPVLRDYRGLSDDSYKVYDPLFEGIHAIIIPWDATPHQFADKLREALKMSDKTYLQHTQENFELTRELFNAKKNAQEIIRLCRSGRKLVRKELEVGKDSVEVKRISRELMEDFYGIQLPLKFTT